MLTGDLVRARAYKGSLRCQFLKAKDDSVDGDARWLCDLGARALKGRWTLGAIEEEIKAEAQVRPDHKQIRGLAKVLLDAADFEQSSVLPPAELRELVFKRAAERAPLALADNPFGRPTSASILAELAAELQTTPEAISQGLYADRKAEMRVSSMPLCDPSGLIERYNTALVQAVLLKAKAVEVRLPGPKAARVRQLLRAAKFQQLMHQARRDGEDLVLTIDGPTSVLRQSTRYGLKLAVFFPHVLLLDRWSIEAEILWKKKTRTLSLDHKVGLVTHVRDRGGYTPREAVLLEERFAKLKTDWTLRPGDHPLDLGGRTVVMPDFTFERKGKVAHLEIIGTWRRDYLSRRIEALNAWGPGNLVLAVSKRLVADKSVLDEFEGTVVPFAEIIPVKKVMTAVEACAR